MIILQKRKIKELVNEKEAEENFKETRKEMEKGDLPAMVIAAIKVFMPVVLVIIGVILLIIWLL